MSLRNENNYTLFDAFAENEIFSKVEASELNDLIDCVGYNLLDPFDDGSGNMMPSHQECTSPLVPSPSNFDYLHQNDQVGSLSSASPFPDLAFENIFEDSPQFEGEDISSDYFQNDFETTNIPNMNELWLSNSNSLMTTDPLPDLGWIKIKTEPTEVVPCVPMRTGPKKFVKITSVEPESSGEIDIKTEARSTQDGHVPEISKPQPSFMRKLNCKYASTKRKKPRSSMHSAASSTIGTFKSLTPFGRMKALSDFFILN